MTVTMADGGACATLADGEPCRSLVVLADIHGMLPALDAVLAEPEVASADRLAVLGDVAAGPQPCAVMDRLLALHDRVVWIRGNADREMLEYRRGERRTIDDPIALWAAGQLQDRHLRALDAHPLVTALAVAGLGQILLCHASPRSDEETLLVDSPSQRWADAFAGLPETIGTVVCGHTHMPFLRLAGGRLAVNPGSVGLPYGRPGAHWALLGPGIGFRRTHVDHDRACHSIARGCAFAGIAEWLDAYLRIGVTEAEARAAFADRTALGGANVHGRAA